MPGKRRDIVDGKLQCSCCKLWKIAETGFYKSKRSCLGKKSNKGSGRIIFVCLQCAYLAGKVDAQIAKDARWYESSCDICHRKKLVSDAKSWNFFTPDQIAMAKSKLRELGLDRRTFAVVEDVSKLVNVVQTVLGKNKSEATKEVLKGIIEKLAKGEPIELFYTKELTYHFTQDVAVLRQKEESKPKKTGSGLVVVENGQTKEM